MSDMQLAIRQNGGSLEDVMNVDTPLTHGGPTPKEYAERLMADIKRALQSFDDRFCPQMLSPEGRALYDKAKNAVNHIDRVMKGAAGHNIDSGPALEQVGEALTALLAIMHHPGATSPAH